MTRLAVPILVRKLRSTGDWLRRAEVELLLKTNAGGWERIRFLVDTGSEMTTFSAAEAKRLNLPMPINAAPGATHTQTGLAIRSGLLRFQIVGMDQTEYIIDCYFLGDPDAPLPPPPNTPRTLFQPLGVIRLLRFTFEDNQPPGVSYGEMIIEKK
jgi:hypothetical protein